MTFQPGFQTRQVPADCPLSVRTHGAPPWAARLSQGSHASPLTPPRLSRELSRPTRFALNLAALPVSIGATGEEGHRKRCTEPAGPTPPAAEEGEVRGGLQQRPVSRERSSQVRRARGSRDCQAAASAETPHFQQASRRRCFSWSLPHSEEQDQWPRALPS